MKRAFFALIVAALSIAIFAACGEASYETLVEDEVIYEDYEDSQAVDIVEDAEIEEEIVAKIVQAEPWQEAYEALLRYYMDTTHYDRFFLYDIDGDGVPELIIGHYAGSLSRMWFDAVYTFADGQAVNIGRGYFANGGGIFAPRYGREGLVVQSYGSTLLVLIEGGTLVTEIALHGPHFLMRHIEGWSIDDKDVTEAEFIAARDEIIGEMGNRTSVWPKELTKDNIHNTVFGWRPTTTWQEAYAALLRSYAQNVLPWHAPDESDVHFILYDISGNGTPELIITDRQFVTSYFVAYTFASGEAVRLDSYYWYDYYVDFFAPPSGMLGIGIHSTTERQRPAVILLMDGEKLIDIDAPSMEVYEWRQLSCYVITEDNIHDIIFGWQPMTWQEAYAVLLHHYATQVIGYSPWGIPNDRPGGHFMLFDIDGDGIPEVIVRDREHFTTYFAVYTFRDGALLRLGARYFYDYGTRFFPLPDNRPGLGMSSNEGVWDSITALVIDGNALVPETTLRRGEGNDGIWWQLNDEYITEEEHASSEERIFGHWEERWHVPFAARIDEYNIIDGIFHLSRPRWIDLGEISIPPSWSYDRGGLHDDLIISGEGVGGTISMLVGYPKAESVESEIERGLSTTRFLFDNGHVGFMVEFSNSIMWIREGWMLINFYHGGDRAIFVSNETLILRIARTLTN